GAATLETALRIVLPLELALRLLVAELAKRIVRRIILVEVGCSASAIHTERVIIEALRSEARLHERIEPCVGVIATGLDRINRISIAGQEIAANPRRRLV